MSRHNPSHKMYLWRAFAQMVLLAATLFLALPGKIAATTTPCAGLSPNVNFLCKDDKKECAKLIETLWTQTLKKDKEDLYMYAVMGEDGQCGHGIGPTEEDAECSCTSSMMAAKKKCKPPTKPKHRKNVETCKIYAKKTEQGAEIVWSMIDAPTTTPTASPTASPSASAVSTAAPTTENVFAAANNLNFDELSEAENQNFNKLCTQEVEKRATETDYQAPDCFKNAVCNEMPCDGDATPHYFYQKDGQFPWEFCRCVSNNDKDKSGYHSCVANDDADKDITTCVLADDPTKTSACGSTSTSAAAIVCDTSEMLVEYEEARTYAQFCVSAFVSVWKAAEKSKSTVDHYQTLFTGTLRESYCKCEPAATTPTCLASKVTCEQDKVCAKAQQNVATRYTRDKPPYYCSIGMDQTKTDTENTLVCTTKAASEALTFGKDLVVDFLVKSVNCADVETLKDSINKNLQEFLAGMNGGDENTMADYVRDVTFNCLTRNSRHRREEKQQQQQQVQQRSSRAADTDNLAASVTFYNQALTDDLKILVGFVSAIEDESFTVTHPETGLRLESVYIQPTGINAATVTIQPTNNGGPSKDVQPIIIGASVGATVFITLVGLLLWNKMHKKQKQVGPMSGGSEEEGDGGGRGGAAAEGSFPFPPKDMFELDRSRLVVGKKLGNGAFGVVTLGRYTNHKGKVMEVAVKQCGADATHQMKTTFLEEARVMKPFVRTPHENIIQMVGTCFQAEPLLLVVELMHTDLLDALRANAPPEAPGFSVPLRVRICVDVASALSYLAKMKFVHRDLACRNILVDEPLNKIKIADFGLSKDVVLEEYYTLASKTILPVRWMAPESLTRGTFSAHTDVWSLGVLFYEVFTHGERPYASVGNAEILDFIKDGKRLRKPTDCPARVFSQMMFCWEATPSERPDAMDVHASLLDCYTTEFVDKGLAKAKPQVWSSYTPGGRGSTSSFTSQASLTAADPISTTDSATLGEVQLPGMASPSPTKTKNLTTKSMPGPPQSSTLPRVREAQENGGLTPAPKFLPRATSVAPALLTVQQKQHKLASSDAAHDAAYMAVTPEGMSAARGQSMAGDNLYTALEPAEKEQPAIREPTFVLDDGTLRNNSSTLPFPTGTNVGAGTRTGNSRTDRTPMPRRSQEMNDHDLQYVPVDRASIAAAAGRPGSPNSGDSFYMPIDRESISTAAAAQPLYATVEPLAGQQGSHATTALEVTDL